LPNLSPIFSSAAFPAGRRTKPALGRFPAGRGFLHRAAAAVYLSNTKRARFSIPDPAAAPCPFGKFSATREIFNPHTGHSFSQYLQRLPLQQCLYNGDIASLLLGASLKELNGISNLRSPIRSFFLHWHFQNRQTKNFNDIEQGKEPTELDIRSELGHDSSEQRGSRNESELGICNLNENGRN
jgi:hypothetical protein